MILIMIYFYSHKLCVLHLAAEILRNSKVASILHDRQVKKNRAMEKAVVSYRHQYQLPPSQHGRDLNDPERCGETQRGEAQMTLPGLVGEDPDSVSRKQRQREQLRGWLLQQQSERAAARHQQKLQGRFRTRDAHVIIPKTCTQAHTSCAFYSFSRAALQSKQSGKEQQGAPVSEWCHGEEKSSSYCHQGMQSGQSKSFSWTQTVTPT